MNPSERIRHKINFFREQFGEEHYFFLLHAAFPLVVNIDLLYCIWKNFQKNIYGERISAPWYCVSDVLMSGFLKVSNYEYYEIASDSKRVLLEAMIERKDLGVERIKDLSLFLSVYSTKNSRRKDTLAKEFMKMQELVALAYIEPRRAIEVLAQAYKDAYQKDQQEYVRLDSIVKDLEWPLSNADKFTDVKAFKYLSSYRKMVSSVMNIGESKIDVPLENSVDAIGIELPTASMLADKKLRDQAEFNDMYAQKIRLLNIRNKRKSTKEELSFIADKKKDDFDHRSFSEISTFPDKSKSNTELSENENDFRPRKDYIETNEAAISTEKYQTLNHNNYQANFEATFPLEDVLAESSEEAPPFDIISSAFEKQDTLSTEITLFPKPEKGTVLSPVAVDIVGKVKFNGTSWRAKIFLEEKATRCEIGDEVSVFARQGVCLLILPKNSSFKSFINKQKGQFRYFKNLFDFSYKSIEDAKHIEFDWPLSGRVQYDITPEANGRVIFEHVSWRAKLHRESRKKKLLRGEFVTVLGREYNVLLVTSK